MGRKAVSDEIKWQIVGLHKARKHSNLIAEICKVSRTCVDSTIQKWLSDKNINDRARSSRPRITAERQDKKLLAFLEITLNGQFVKFHKIG
jgi:hypothetical protein